MSFASKLKRELKAVALAALYFGCWIAALLFIKSLVLAEYSIEFRHYSLAVVGALILSKVVLILEHVPLGPWVRSRPAWVDVALRTVLYSAGVALVMILEKGIEGRHEHGGFVGAVRSTLQSEDVYHLWANSVCITGAILVYNALSVVRHHLGEGGLARLFFSSQLATKSSIRERESVPGPHSDSL
jgi:hypothetical protein